MSSLQPLQFLDKLTSQYTCALPNHEQQHEMLFHSSPSCNLASSITFLKAVVVPMKIQNLLLYMSLGLHVAQPAMETLKKVSVSVLRTSLFYGFSASIFSRLRCAIVKWVGDKLAVFLPAWISFSLCSLIEDRTQLCNTLMWQGSYSVAAIGNIAVAKKILPNWTHGPVLVFAVAFSILYTLYRKQKAIPTIPLTVIKIAIPARNERDIVEKLLETKIFGPLPEPDNNEEWKFTEIVAGVTKNFVTGLSLGSVGGIAYLCWNGWTAESFKFIAQQTLRISGVVGLLPLINRTFPLLLKNFTNKNETNSNVVLLLNGFVSGLTICLYPSPVFISHAVSNALFALASAFIERHHQFQSYFYPFFFYGLSVATNIYAIYFEPSSISPDVPLLTLAGGDDVEHFSKVINTGTGLLKNAL